MKPVQIDRFFKVLSRELGEEGRAILTGAAAGALWGNRRPSLDVDFALELRRRSPALWQTVEEAIQRTVQLTGIQANYAEDIDRWGQITLGDYRKHTRIYKRFGRLRLELLDPVYWSIGKMTRYLEPDIQDMVAVFRTKKISWKKLTLHWGHCLRASPRSVVQAQFRRQVEDFLRRYGTAIWGARFSAARAQSSFYSAAGIP
jgi:hypothetical protein